MIVVKMPFNFDKISKCKSLSMTISFQLSSNNSCITNKIIFVQSSFCGRQKNFNNKFLRITA